MFTTRKDIDILNKSQENIYINVEDNNEKAVKI